MAHRTDYRAVLEEASQHQSNSLEGWDPQRMDYESSEFNRYDVGPGRYLPRKQYGGDRSSEEGITLFVQGIPNEMTEEGLENLFCKAGKVLRVKKMLSKKPEAGNTYGFITMSTVNEATKAMQMYHNFSIGQYFHLSVRVSMSDEERRKRQQQKQEEEEFLNSLPSNRKAATNGFRFASGNESDSSSSSAGKQSMPLLKMQQQQKSPGSSASSGNYGYSNYSDKPGILGPGPPLNQCIHCQHPGVIEPCIFGGSKTGQILPGDLRAHKAVNLSEIDPSVIHNSSPQFTGLGSRFGTGDQRLPSTPKDSSQQNKLSGLEDLKITIGQDSSGYGDGSRHISAKGAASGNAILSLGRGRGRGSLLSMVETNNQIFRGESPVYSHNKYSNDDTDYNGGYAYDSMGTYGHGMNMRGFKDHGRDYESGYGGGYGRGHHGYRSGGYSGGQRSDYRRDQHWSDPRSYGRGHKMGYERDYYNGHRHNRDYSGQFGRGRGYGANQYYYQDYKKPGSYSGPKYTQGYNKTRHSRDNIYKDDVDKVKHVEKQICSTCGTLGTFNCSRCKTPYCSEDCQRRAWPEHKKICKRLSESNKDDKKFEQQFDISFGDDIVDRMKNQVEKVTGDKVEVKPREVKQEPTSSRRQSPKKQSGAIHVPKVNTADLAASDLGLTGLAGKIPVTTSPTPAKETSSEQILMEQQRQLQTQLPRNEGKEVVPVQLPPAEIKQSVVSEVVIKVDQLPLPDLPIDTETEVAVTEVEGPDSIWVQDIDSYNAANDLLIKLNEASQTAESVSDPVVGGIYLSQYSVDNAWYRTVVESISGDHVSVCFIDYGNREVALASGLKKLPKNLAQEPLKAVRCYLGNLPSTLYDDDKAKSIVMLSVEPVFKCQQLYRVTALRKDKNRYAVTIKDPNGDDVSKKLIDAGLVQTDKTRKPAPDTSPKTTTVRSSPHPMMSTASGFTPPSVELPLNEEIEVMISEVSGPDEIYVQFYSTETFENIQKFPQEMTEVCSKVTTPLSSPVVGVICAAKYSVDGQWYRARIEAIPERDVAAVLFIDFGNRENVQFANLLALPQQFLRVKVMAMKCYLDDDTNFTWDKQAIAAVKEILVPTLNCGKIYSLVATKKDDKGYGVLMKTADGLDVMHMMRNGKSTEVQTQVKEPIAESPSITDEGYNQIQYASLPLNEEVEVVVTEVVSPAEVWINLLPDVGSGAQINSVLTQIISEFSHVQSPVVGGIYAGQFSVDNTWYRARVESLDGTNKVNVVYIDYGNKETISVDHLRELHPDLLVPEAYGIQCCIDGISPPNGENNWSDAAIKFFKTVAVPSAACKQSYKVTAIKKQDNVCFVILKDASGVDLSQRLVEKGMALSVAAPPSSKPVPPQSIPQAAKQLKTIMTTDIGCLATEVREGEVLKLLIVEIESPTHFYVQINDDARIATYSELQKELDNMAVNCTEKEYRPKVIGELVIALFSGQWFRAEVLSIGQTKCGVFYIDFGNKEEVDFSMVRPAFEASTRLPAQAMICALDNVTMPSSGSWTREDTELFTQLIISQTSPGSDGQEAHVKRIVGRTVYIDIKTGSGDSMSNLFMQSRTSASPEPAQIQASIFSAPKMDLSLGQRVDSVVVTFNNFHSFYLQPLADDQIDLRNLMVNIGEHCMSDENPHCPIVGELVCAKYEGVWYRACVMDIIDGYYVVHYIDFGNSESVDSDSIRKLPQSFATVPVQAVHCRLSGVGLEAQTEETLTSFVASTVNVASKTEAVRKTGSQYEVIIYSNDGVNINEQLQPLPNANMPIDGAAASLQPNITSMTRTTPPGREFDLIITFAVSPEEFYVQICDQEAVQQLAVFMREMMNTCETQGPDPSFNPNIDTLCCGFYHEDDSWYRGVVTQTYQNGTYQVHYIDFGNKEIVTADKLRPITPEFLELPIMAIRCRLADIEPVGSTWNPEAARMMKLFFEKRLHAILMDQSAEVCSLRLVDYDNDINIADYLINNGVAQRSGTVHVAGSGDGVGHVAGGGDGTEHVAGGGDAADNDGNDEEELQRQILALQAKLSSMKTKK